MMNRSATFFIISLPDKDLPEAGKISLQIQILQGNEYRSQRTYASL